MLVMMLLTMTDDDVEKNPFAISIERAQSEN